MKPFTDFPYLRQAFTEGERWPVAEDRIDAPARKPTCITPDQAAAVPPAGAIGSHLENLERNEGFKGFNQKGVSEIIARTDPRAQASPLNTDFTRGPPERISPQYLAWLIVSRLAAVPIMPHVTPAALDWTYSRFSLALS